MQIICDYSKDITLTNQSGTSFIFKKCSSLYGELKICAWDGPLNTREYQRPSWYKIEFLFNYEGHKCLYKGSLSCLDLLFTEGQNVREGLVKYSSNATPIQDVVDTGQQTYYQVGNCRRSVSIKYMDTEIELQKQKKHALIRCRHYDNSDFANYRIIYYFRNWLDLIFLRKTKIFIDAEGTPQDFDLHGEGYVDIDYL